MFRIILLMMPLSLWAQISVFDSFQDGDFTKNPPWWGDTTLFKVQTQTLSLCDSQSGASFLALQSQISEQAEWYWKCRLDFNPSSSNYLDLVLFSDRDSLDSYYQGYYLRLGGAKDQISLWRKDLETDSLLASSAEGLLDSNQLTLKLKVQRDSDFTWQVLLDSTSIWKSLFNVKDAKYRLARASGWHCFYTKTRASSFYLDSMHIRGFPAFDSVAPRVIDSEFTKGKLLIDFDEPLTKVDSVVYNDAKLNFGISDHQLSISASAKFAINDSFQIQLYAVEDLFGNSKDTNLTLIQIQAFWGDVRFSEIMADPSPLVGSSLLGFPEVEYLELFNSSEYNFSLKGWQLIIGDKNFALDTGILAAGAYLLFCDEDNAELWSRNYNPYFLPWSVYQLANNGTFLALVSSEGRWIDSVFYRSYWHEDLKETGGWSLECRDLTTDCRKEANWSSSVSTQGGTPGAPNSMEGSLHDSLGPQLISWALQRDDFLLIDFNERITNDTIAYSINPSWPVESLWVQENQLCLFFKQALLPKQSYTLKWDSALFDCVNNQSEPDSLVFSLAAPAEKGQVRISEVMFNPSSSGIDFIELYNYGNSQIDLQELRLCTWDYIADLKGAPLLVADASRYLEPGKAIALAEDIESLMRVHNTTEKSCLEVNSLPSMPDAGAALQVLNSSFESIDRVVFSEKSHSPYLADHEGVSLNRKYWQGDAIRDHHWESSTKAENYASPGRVIVRETSSSEVLWKPDPEYFTPNGDGDKDAVDLAYNFEQAGYWAQVFIFDHSGVLQRELESGAVVSQQGSFLWKGENERGELCPSGIYMAVLRYLDEHGHEGRTACTLTLIR